MELNVAGVISSLIESFVITSKLGPLMQLAIMVSLLSFAITTLLGFSLGGVLAVKRFDGKQRILDYLQRISGAALILVGLLVYLALCYSNSQGVTGLMEAPAVLIAFQVIFVMPSVTIGTQKIIEVEWKQFKPQLRFWRMNAQQALPTLFWKARVQLLHLAVITYGRVVAELGGLALLCTTLDYLMRPQVMQGAGEATLQLGLVLLLAAATLLSLKYLCMPHKNTLNS